MNQYFFMDLNKKVWQYVLLFALAFIWGSSFILMKKGLQSYSNIQVAAFRIFFSFIFFIPFIIRHIKKLSNSNIKSLLIAGFIGNGIPAFFFTTAQMHISSSLAGILNSLTPIFTLLVGIIFYTSKVKIINIIGLFIGLVGAVGLVFKDTISFFDENNIYALLVVAATLFYGINVNEVKHKLQSLNGVAISALSFMFMGPICGIYLLFSDFSQAIASPDFFQNTIYIVLLSFFSSFLAVIGINVLIKHVTPVFASSVTYIIPIFAMMWGIFDGESILLIDVLWILTILVGIYLVNKKSVKK